MFTDRQISAMRERREKMMKETCTLIYGDSTFQATGGGKGTYSDPTSTPTRCLVSPLGSDPQERLIADRVAPVAVLILSVPIDAVMDGLTKVNVRGKDHEVLGVVPARTYPIERRVVVQDG